MTEPTRGSSERAEALASPRRATQPAPATPQREPESRRDAGVDPGRQHSLRKRPALKRAKRALNRAARDRTESAKVQPADAARKTGQPGEGSETQIARHERRERQTGEVEPHAKAERPRGSLDADLLRDREHEPEPSQTRTEALKVTEVSERSQTQAREGVAPVGVERVQDSKPAVEIPQPVGVTLDPLLGSTRPGRDLGHASDALFEALEQRQADLGPSQDRRQPLATLLEPTQEPIQESRRVGGPLAGRSLGRRCRQREDARDGVIGEVAQGEQVPKPDGQVAQGLSRLNGSQSALERRPERQARVIGRDDLQGPPEVEGLELERLGGGLVTSFDRGQESFEDTNEVVRAGARDAVGIVLREQRPESAGEGRVGALQLGEGLAR
ncbi:MAG: hypothetical protein JKY65_02835 [Planctomycetes bacterium]|nr:hypothetical protein [Planctomycetota bacterium]